MLSVFRTFLMVSLSATYALSAERTVISASDGRTAVVGQKYAVGSYIYVNSPGVGTNGYVYVAAGSYLDGNSPANQNSTVVTEAGVTRAATAAQVGLISARLNDVTGNATAPTSNTVSLLGEKGGNAGNSMQRFGIWARGSWNRIDDNARNGAWNADLWSLAVGGDYKINDSVLAGVALMFSYLDGKTEFNNGTIRDGSYGLMPYLGVRVNQWLGLDAMVGYSQVDKKRDRRAPTTTNAGGGVPTGAKITSSPKSDRYMAAFFANLTRTINKINLLGRFGITHSEDQQKAFSENNGDKYKGINTRLTQGQVRLQAGYQASERCEPYIFATYAYDLTATKAAVAEKPVDMGANTVNYVSPNKDRSKHTYGGGLGTNIRATNALSGSLEGSYGQNEKLKNYGIMARIRYKF